MISEVVFIGGRSGSGKTSVGFEVHELLVAAGVRHCLVDGDFLDMSHPAAPGLAERNLAQLWSNYRALGYRRIIYVNTACVLPEETTRLTRAMGDEPKVLAVLLDCADSTAQERLRTREIGSGFDRHLAAGRSMADQFAARELRGVHRLVTDRRSVCDIAAEVIELTGWY